MTTPVFFEQLVTAPTGEPVTLEEVKAAAKVEIVEDDGFLIGLMESQARVIESWLRRALITQTWDYLIDAFPADNPIVLPRPPLQTVVSVKYLDAAGVEQTVDPANYVVIKDNGPMAARAYLMPIYGQTWPAALARPDAVRIRHTSGYGTRADVPDAVRVAIGMQVAWLYENRAAYMAGNAGLNPAVDALLYPYRAW